MYKLTTRHFYSELETHSRLAASRDAPYFTVNAATAL